MTGKKNLLQRPSPGIQPKHQRRKRTHAILCNTRYESGNSVFNQTFYVVPIYPIYIRNAYGNIMTDRNGHLYDYEDGKINALNRPVLLANNLLPSDLLETSNTMENMFSVGIISVNVPKNRDST